MNRYFEELFADFYKDRNNGIEAHELDLELMAFVGEMTRDAAIRQEAPDEKAFRKIVDFMMGQEAGLK